MANLPLALRFCQHVHRRGHSRTDGHVHGADPNAVGTCTVLFLRIREVKAGSTSDFDLIVSRPALLSTAVYRYHYCNPHIHTSGPRHPYVQK